MKKLAELTLIGDLEKGLQVNLKIEEDALNVSLPASLELLTSYQNWSSYYDYLANPASSSRIIRVEREFNQNSFSELGRLAKELRDNFNHWLNNDSFHPIQEKLLEHLTLSHEMRVIILTRSLQLRQLPWHEWDLGKEHNVEVALGTTKIQLRLENLARKRPRILAILGDKSGIDVSQDRKLLERLDAEVVFLVEPERKILNKNLWDRKGWDILFFAGHSQSENEGTQGRIYFNAKDSLTIEELNYGFQKAGERGLQIAIFNSCDGLGIASELANLNIPQIIVMRKPVPNLVAEEFLKYFLDEFTNGESFYQSVGNARKQLQGLEDEFPCATWLPIIVQNPLSIPPIWRQLCNKPQLYSSPKDYRNRQALLDKVRESWIEGVLDSENSLHNRVLIELGLESRPDAVLQPWDMEYETSEQLRKPIPSGTKVIDIFNQIEEGRTLLILGEPGSGKTTTLLELARNLIERAEADIDRPIPVVFNLSSWGSRKTNQTIDDWLIQELHQVYKVPKKLGNSWLENQQLLLLLDGLDEVKTERRNLCIQKLNQFVKQYRQTEIVITSRIKDYENLSHRLDFQSAIYLQPLTPVQINRYFYNAGSQLAVVKTLWREDMTLQELAKSPLMLNIMTLAYRGMKSEDLPPINSLEERRNHLFNHYIKQMFTHRQSSSKQRYPVEKVINWLIWMAKRMSQEFQTVFLIERMQPSWLLNRTQKWIYRIGFVLATGIIFGLLVNLIFIFTGELIYLPIFELLYGSEYRNTTSLIDRVIYQLNIGIIRTGLTIAVIDLIYSKLRNKEEIKLFETIILSGKRLRHNFITGVGTGIIIGIVLRFIPTIIFTIKPLLFSIDSSSRYLKFTLLIYSIVICIFFWEIIRLFWKRGNVSAIRIISEVIIIQILLYSLINESVIYLFQDILVSLLYGLIGGFINALYFALKGDDLDKRTIPNQGIRKTVINTGIFALIFGLLLMAIIALISWITGRSFISSEGNTDGLSLSLYYGIFYGFLFALIPGIPTIKHFTLRVILYCQGHIPWNYARFLNYATERIFLQKVGGGYIFIHRLLLEHFARMEIKR